MSKHTVWRAILAVGLIIALMLVVVQQEVADSIEWIGTEPADVTAAPTPIALIEAEVESVDLSIAVPDGWQAQPTDGGILLARYFDTMQGDHKLTDMQVHLFVHRIDAFDSLAADRANNALEILKHVVEQPTYIGEAVASSPIPLASQPEAAYYLLNNRNESITLMIGMTVRDPLRLVGLNISAPFDQADKIRSLLPVLLTKIRVNDSSIDARLIDALPDPLIFPAYPN